MENEKDEAPFLGALIDERSESEKEKDFKFEETVAAIAPVKWEKKDEDEIRRFPIFDQDGSGSCVAQTIAKLAGIMYAQANAGEYVHFSATHVYQRRLNRPAAGMAGVNAFDIARTSITLEELVPSQKMTDAAMDAVSVASYKNEVGKIFRFGNYVVMPTRDIDVIASTIQQTGKGVMVWFWFKSKEWKKAMPEVLYPDLANGAAAARHSVTAVDFLLLPDGRKAIVIEDSWGNDTGIEGQRIITEDFFEKRNFFAAYPINFKFQDAEGDVDQSPERPRYTFNQDLKFFADPMPPHPDVVALQEVLKFEGFFPNNIASSGYYGAITAKAVLAWQLKNIPEYGIDELKKLEGKVVGPSTRKVLNQKYSI